LLFYYKITVLPRTLLEIHEKSANVSIRRKKDQKPDLSGLGDLKVIYSAVKKKGGAVINLGNHSYNMEKT